MSTKIEWCDEVLNLITGCTPISEGCQNCYASRMAQRLRGRYGYPKDEPFRPATFHKDMLHRPFEWKKSRRIFVCSMGDLFHESVPFGMIDNVQAVMRLASQHIYLLLTKRPERMSEYFRSNESYKWINREHGSISGGRRWSDVLDSHIQLGVTAENQKCADHRIPILMGMPSDLKFVSLEPLLEPIDISFHLSILVRGLDWVVVGPETGPGARPCKRKWIQDIISQCRSAGVPYFVKKWPDGRPVQPRDRQFPICS